MPLLNVSRSVHFVRLQRLVVGPFHYLIIPFFIAWVEHASADYEYASARQDDVLNKTFESAEANRFVTHTQGLSLHRLL